MVRLEHAAAVTSSAGLRTNLGGGNDQYEPVADFVTVSAELQRGQNVPFTLTVPLRSAEEPSLGIRQPGVYPLLVNANGTPDYGAPARLDDARFLLPVLGVPPEPCGRLVGRRAGRRRSRPTPPNPCASPCCGRWPIGPGWRRVLPAGRRRCG